MTYFKFALIMALSILIAGCSPEPARSTATLSQQPTNTPTMAATSIPTAVLAASATPIVRSSATALQLAVFSPTPPATQTPLPSPTTQGDVSAAASLTLAPSPTVPAVIDTYWLSRPISRSDDPDRIDYIDRTYPYGGTQFSTREVHLGVEFVNKRFTPILAAAEGIVLFAGSDDEIQVGPVRNYYGNVIVVQHQFLGVDEAVFTVYGHLQDVLVETGQTLSRGERIGRVGDTGIAVGPHLHFEVRVEDGLDYRRTRNPALWIAPFPQTGTLAGRLVVERTTAENEAETGENQSSEIEQTEVADPEVGRTILVRNEDFTWETYTYGSDRVNSSALWNENFVMPDLPVGEYEVIVSNENGRNLFRSTVEIRNGGTTFINVDVTQ
ncbi:MAG: hypothetical protein CL607_14060 [Anaerolineaceae bacterium]|nr:hypothetical protein [Anaerolineaceae bacterium]